MSSLRARVASCWVGVVSTGVSLVDTSHVVNYLDGMAEKQEPETKAQRNARLDADDRVLDQAQKIVKGQIAREIRKAANNLNQ